MNIERHRQLLFSGAAALGGTLLFAYAVRAVGLPVIADGIRRVGAGVFIILARLLVPVDFGLVALATV